MTTKTLERSVRKTAKGADTKALATALGSLVKARLAKPKPQPKFIAWDFAEKPKAKRVTRSKRRGRNQPYVKTSKPDVSRLGTWRHYMLSVIRRHSSTWDAEAEHATCDNPNFAKNRLDFSFAAREGYIDFI